MRRRASEALSSACCFWNSFFAEGFVLAFELLEAFRGRLQFHARLRDLLVRQCFFRLIFGLLFLERLDFLFGRGELFGRCLELLGGDRAGCGRLFLGAGGLLGLTLGAFLRELRLLGGGVGLGHRLFDFGLEVVHREDRSRSRDQHDDRQKNLPVIFHNYPFTPIHFFGWPKVQVE